MKKDLERAEDHFEQVRSRRAAPPEVPLWLWGTLTALALWTVYLWPNIQARLRARRWGRGALPNSGAPVIIERAGPPSGGGPDATADSAPTMAAEVEVEDDLTRLVGLGPANASRLREAGLGTFSRVARATGDDLLKLVRGVAHDRVRSWPAQAERAAAGDWDGLANLQAELRARRAADSD